jgi:hypothetical protein
MINDKFIEGNIYHAGWKDYEKSNHCFEGLLIVKKETSDIEPSRLILVDTYWDSGGNKWFTFDEASKQLDLTYYCNLNDFDLSKNVKGAPLYYEESDYVFLHSQHQCSENCKYYYVRKGAIRSTIKMMQSIEAKREKHLRDINYAQSAIEWIDKDIEKLKAGDFTSVYI